MRSRTTKQVRDRLEGLPESVPRLARDAYRTFRENPFHPSLQFKPIAARTPSLWSVRIGIHYRAMGIRDADSIL